MAEGPTTADEGREKQRIFRMRDSTEYRRPRALRDPGMGGEKPGAQIPDRPSVPIAVGIRGPAIPRRARRERERQKEAARGDRKQQGAPGIFP